MALGKILNSELSSGGSSAIADALGLYIDNDGYLCQEAEQEDNTNE